MEVKIQTIKKVVLIVSLISAALNTLEAVLMGTPWWAWITTAAGTFLIVFYISEYFLHRYVIDRIKPLYQLLLSRDIITSRLSKALRKKANDDLIDDIQENLDHLVSFGENDIERLLRQEQDRSRFLEGIVHEIENPVSNILSYSNALLEGALRDPVSGREYVERIVRSANRLVTQIGDINKLSSYKEGGAVMYKEVFELTDLVHEVFDTNILNARKYGIRFKLDRSAFPSKERVLVYADTYRIGMVLNNLVLNAMQFNKMGGWVTVRFVDMFDKILVEVSDTGIGISPQNLPHIFERLYKVDRSRSEGGAGLGLAAVKLILDTHGENITVRSEVGVGSTFSFTLSRPPR